MSERTLQSQTAECGFFDWRIFRMHILERAGYELRLMGSRAILPPLITAAGYIPLAWLLTYLKTPPQRFLESGPEMLIPMIAGMFAGTLACYDPALELQLTLPALYRRTGMLRILLMLSWGGLIACLFISSLFGLKQDYMLQPPQPQPPLLALLVRQLVWLGPLLWCTGSAICVSLLMRSRIAGAALLGGIWITEILFKDLLAGVVWLRPVLLFPTTLVTPPTTVPEALYAMWLTNRVEVLTTGLVLILLAWLLLHRPESLLQAVHEE
jgi:hypothetical protein